jgi:hypothetical protein
MYGKVERDGNTVVELDPDFTFDPNPKTYNYNAMAAFAGGDGNQPVDSPVEGTPDGNSLTSTVGFSSRIPDLPVTTPSSDVQPTSSRLPSSDVQPTLSPLPSSDVQPTSSPLPSSSPSPSPSSSPSSYTSPASSPSLSPYPSEGPELSPVPSPSPPIQLNSEDNGDPSKISRRYHRRSSH